MNEFIFLIHAIFISAAVLGACKLGKTSLTALFCLLAFVANLLLFKQIDFLGLIITCTDAYAIGCFFFTRIDSILLWGESGKRCYLSLFLSLNFFNNHIANSSDLPAKLL